MRKTNIVIGIWSLALTVGFIASPYGLFATLDIMKQNKEISERIADTELRLNAANAGVLSAATQANESRTFDIYYGDIENITTLFKSIGGIEVQSVMEVNPLEGFKEVAPIIIGQQPSAVKYNLVVENIQSTLGVLESMELPVYSIVIEEPNKLSVTFMTGGSL